MKNKKGWKPNEKAADILYYIKERLKTLFFFFLNNFLTYFMFIFPNLPHCSLKMRMADNGGGPLSIARIGA
jgi:hypothetical protein